MTCDRKSGHFVQDFRRRLGCLKPQIGKQDMFTGANPAGNRLADRPSAYDDDNIGHGGFRTRATSSRIYTFS